MARPKAPLWSQSILARSPSTLSKCFPILARATANGDGNSNAIVANASRLDEIGGS